MAGSGACLYVAAAGTLWRGGVGGAGRRHAAFQKFNFGSNWMVEYGNPDREADFHTLIAYSPLHNVRSEVGYPPLLVLTADNDDRVAPTHAYKFVATIQEHAPAGETYLRVERRAGHGPVIR